MLDLGIINVSKSTDQLDKIDVLKAVATDCKSKSCVCGYATPLCIPTHAVYLNTITTSILPLITRDIRVHPGARNLRKNTRTHTFTHTYHNAPPTAPYPTCQLSIPFIPPSCPHPAHPPQPRLVPFIRHHLPLHHPLSCFFLCTHQACQSPLSLPSIRLPSSRTRYDYHPMSFYVQLYY